jgi:protein-S-isoprenylcysteine O-methyltransferase Ste14
MLLRAVVAFVALPGIVAYVLPLLLAPAPGDTPPWHWAGLALITAGTVLLLWCVRDFYVAGKGTLAPWSPPRNLVVTGLYRFSRNPMYVAVSIVLLGWAVWYTSTGLLLYAAIVAIAFQLRILLYEEPHLENAFGQEWLEYRKHVRRWF